MSNLPSGYSFPLVQCALEMLFCREFQSLPDQTLEEYFGTSLSGFYAGTGLNVISPLLQPVNPTEGNCLEGNTAIVF
jgi:hypothetical protein